MYLSIAWRSIPFTFLLLFLPYFAIANDEQALLEFAALISHGRKLNWSSHTPVCSSWVGVRCTPDRTRVRYLRLPAVGLIGPLPPNTLEKLDALEVLSLRSNRLTENLPANVSSIPSLHSLYLHHNNLSGVIPSLLSPNLRFLILSYNSFTGEIPSTITNLTNLEALHLENNYLSGAIPDLHLPRLRLLNLSYNNLSGPIPLSLQKFPVESFSGNPFLCGTPLSQCTGVLPPPPPSSPRSAGPSKSKRSLWKRIPRLVKICIAIGGSLLVPFSLITILVIIFKSRHEEGSAESEETPAAVMVEDTGEQISNPIEEGEREKLVFFEGYSSNFDLEILLRVFAEPLGRGTFGHTFKGVMDDGRTVVVKRFKNVFKGKREFEMQMEMIERMGQHRNIAPLQAYYYSEDQQLLVSDYFTSGSLSTLLHGHDEAGVPLLDWTSRMKVSLGVADAIAHIHNAAGGSLTHGNIKSSNVFLSPDLEPLVSDYGVVPLIKDDFWRTLGYNKLDDEQQQHPTNVRKHENYDAPEFIKTPKATKETDVYSFGVLLLEMISGRDPLVGRGCNGEMSLARWIRFVLEEEWSDDVFDVNLMRGQREKKEMFNMLEIAILCTEEAPDRRPAMEQIVKKIEEVRRSNLHTPPIPSPELFFR